MDFYNMAYSEDSGLDLKRRDVFICGECGEEFRFYRTLVVHMRNHKCLDLSCAGDNGSYIDASIEVALHRNGTLTLVDHSVLSNFTFLFGSPPSKQSLFQTCEPNSLKPSKVNNKGNTLIKCDKCGQLFQSQKTLQMHQEYRTLEQGFNCTLCCKTFNEKENLQSHLRNHAHEQFYSCGQCGKKFLRKETLLSHHKQWHDPLRSEALKKSDEGQENVKCRSYPCKSCGLQFFWLSDLQSHLKSHLCDTGPQKDTQTLMEEENKSIRLNSNGLPCDPDSQINPNSELKNHHTSQHLKARFNLLDNDQHTSYGSNGTVRKEVTKKKRQQRGPNMKVRSRRDNRKSFGTKKFPCKQCHHVFVHSSSLSRHMRFHKGTLHTCVYCGRQFFQRCDVTRHVAIYHKSVNETEEELTNTTGGKQVSVKVPTQVTDNGEDKDLEVLNSHSSCGAKRFLGCQERKPYNSRMSYKCKDCFRVFRIRSVYQHHLQFHKRNPSKTYYCCHICPSRFGFRSAFEHHLENHKKDIAFIGNVPTNGDQMYQNALDKV